MSIFKQLTLAELASLFGGTEREVRDFCGDQLKYADLSYVFAVGEERDAILLQILKRLDAADLKVAGVARQDDWEKGWGENLKEVEIGDDPHALVPKYFRSGQPIRLFSKLAKAAPNFVLDYTEVYRAWLFRKFLADAPVVYEFGCGTGTHLAYLAATFPDKTLMGLDWTEASGKILQMLAARNGWNLTGHRFDFFDPDKTLKLAPGAAVLTYGALEQVGERFTAFLDYLLEQKPALCLHVEPMNEFYDTADLIDYLGLRYHQRRGYLNGFLDMLRKLEAEGKIAIDKVHRHSFGGTYVETYSYVAWHPK